jgi:hypothetical protein
MPLKEVEIAIHSFKDRSIWSNFIRLGLAVQWPPLKPKNLVLLSLQREKSIAQVYRSVLSQSIPRFKPTDEI